MADLTLTFLGTGTSVGIPAVGCDCDTCRSTDPRDKRCRSSVWMQTAEASWLIDSTPDLRYQCLRAGIRELNAALFTHGHMDHVTGFDDLRRFTLEMDQYLPIYATPPTLEVLTRMYEFAFNGENRYRGYLKPFPKPVYGPFYLEQTKVTPLPVLHGKVDTVGYLFERHEKPLCAYICDCKVVTDEALAAMEGVDTLIIDALRYTPHPTHMNIDEALAVQQQLRPRRTYFTHFQCEIMHSRVEPTLPDDIRLAYDTLTISWD